MINFKKVRYKNLLSSGNKFTEIRLDKHQTTLILGENGSGKSTLLDALCFGLYGRGFRNLKKDLLINSINEKGLEVEIEFSIGTKQYKVIRGAKPNKFELYLDDVMLNQDANVRDYQEHLEKQILKMSFRSFTQVAILGSANFTPFMQLKAKDRRNLVEDLLDISIFSTMQDILRKRISTHQNEITETSHEINIMEERIHGLNEQLNVLRENRESKILKYESTVGETQDNINQLMENIDEKTQDVVAQARLIEDKDTKENKLTELMDLERQLETARKKTIREIKFYEDNDECPTCEQSLDETHKKEHIEQKETKKTELSTAIEEIEKQIGECSRRLEEIREIQSKIEEIQKKISLLQTEVVSNQKYITKLQKEIEDLKGEATAGSDAEDKIVDSEDKLEVLLQKKETQTETLLVSLNAIHSPYAPSASCVANASFLVSGNALVVFTTKRHVARIAATSRSAFLLAARASQFTKYAPFFSLASSSGKTQHNAEVAAPASVDFTNGRPTKCKTAPRNPPHCFLARSPPLLKTAPGCAAKKRTFFWKGLRDASHVLAKSFAKKIKHSLLSA